MEKSVIKIQDDEQPPEFSTLHHIARLETLLVTVFQQLSELKSGVFTNARIAEEAKTAPLPVLKDRDEDVMGAS